MLWLRIAPAAVIALAWWRKGAEAAVLCGAIWVLGVWFGYWRGMGEDG
jgi:hypothetical protein